MLSEMIGERKWSGLVPLEAPLQDSCPVSASLDVVTRNFFTVISLVSVQGTKADYTHSTSMLGCSFGNSYPMIGTYCPVSDLHLPPPRSHVPPFTLSRSWGLGKE